MTSTAARPLVPAPPRLSRARLVVRTAGEVLITLGVVLLLFCVYELYITNLFTARDQSRLDSQLTRGWAGPSVTSATPTGPVVQPEPSLGTAFARFYLPRLRGLQPLVVVEGVGVADLQKGPGHLPTSAQPGQVGNLVLSGHRTTYGAPFGDIDQLRAGDALVVETRDSWFTYRVTDSQVVLPTAVEVTAPVRGRPGAVATSAAITLTTCNPKFSARQRLIIGGELAESRPKTSGRPASLSEG